MSYQLSRQRLFSSIFCTQIPLEPARKLYRLGVLFTGENVRCCAALILKVKDISDTFLCHSLAQCKQAFILSHSSFLSVVSTEFHCAILSEENRITSKILSYQLSRQRLFSSIFCTQIPLEPARKLYRLGVLFTGENVRCCAALIFKVKDISDTFLCHSLAQCKQAFIRYQIAFYFDKKGVPVYCRYTISLVRSVGRAPVC